jgi:uncharacterized protein YndB with AHSA1/START domain
MPIVVSTLVSAPLSVVWRAYTTPEDIQVWNAASADWHTPAASVDLRTGGRFCFRMEARDGSGGFDFEGVYTRVEPMRRLEYDFGDRHAVVTFKEVDPGAAAAGVEVTVAFDPETTHPEEAQREGWQAILDHFARHVAASR